MENCHSSLCTGSTQNAREEVTDVPEAVLSGALHFITGEVRHRDPTKGRKRKQGKLGAGEVDEESGEVKHLHQLEKLQFLLKQQADALIGLGFDPSVKVRVSVNCV